MINSINCRKYEGQSYKYPPEPPLSRERVACERAFSYCGVGYTGPIFIKNIYGSDDHLYKSWILFITCASSRAIYLDLVTDSSGPACINMLNRFFNTFGAPKQFISDNGGAFNSEETHLFIKNRNIEILNGHLTNRLHHGQVDFLKDSPSLKNEV